MATQTTSAVLPSSATFFRRLVAGILVLDLFVATVATLWLSHAREQDLANARVTTQNLARALDQYVGGTMASVDLTLLAFADEYARHADRLDGKTLDRLLAQHLAHQPALDSLRLTDAQGAVRHGPGVPSGAAVSVADRDFFLAARNEGGLAISKPLLARISKKWVITLARRVNRADGSFAGVVYANLAIDRLRETFADLNVGRLGAVTLRDADLGIVARHPEPGGVGSMMGSKAVAPQFRSMVDAGQREGTFSGISGSDGVERIFSFRRIRGYPFYVAVALAHDDVLAEWRSEVARVAAIIVLFLAMTLTAAQLLFSAWKRQVTTTEALLDEEMKFRTLADYTRDWAYWQSADRRQIIYMTPSCEEITGYTPEEFAADPSLPFRIVHADDQPSMARHLDRYEIHGDDVIEFRIVRRDGEVRWIEHACRPIFQPDGRFLGRRVGNRDITDRKRIEENERRLQQSLRGLNEVAALSHLPFAEQLRRALDTGARHLGLELGIASHIEGDRYEVLSQISPPGTLSDGQVFNAGLTYCAITLVERRVVAISHMGVSGYIGHPCYREFNLETYIGAPVFVGGKIFGTVNFSSAQPYAREFDDGDKEFVALLARWAGSAIERHQTEQALRNSEARLREAQRIAQIGHWELDLVTNKALWSEEVFHIFEIDPQRFGATYEAFLAAIHPDDREQVNLTYTNSVKNRMPYEVTHRLLMPDGNVKYVHEHGETFYDKQGKPIRSVGTVQDVTIEVLNQEALRESEERFRTIADYTYDWEYWQGPQGEFLYVSPSCERITGYSQAEFISQPGLVYDIIHADDRHLMAEHVEDIRHEDEGAVDFRIVRKDGEVRWIAHGCRAIYADDGRFLGRRASNRDITDRKHAEEQVQQLAYYDVLTGLPNRRMLFDRFALALTQAKRFRRSLAVMFLDLDNFKQINDTLGHEVGDELLKEVAIRLASCVRAGDTVSRQGGDEFVIVLTEVADPKDAARVAEKIIPALRQPVTVDDHVLHVTTSIGIAVYPIDGTDDVRELLIKADQAMYAAKAAGRDGYRFFGEGEAT